MVNVCSHESVVRAELNVDGQDVPPSSGWQLNSVGLLAANMTADITQVSQSRPPHQMPREHIFSPFSSPACLHNVNIGIFHTGLYSGITTLAKITKTCQTRCALHFFRA